MSDAPDPFAAEHEVARASIRKLRGEIREADPRTMRLLLTEARSHNGFLHKPVPEALLHRIWDILVQGPTSANQQPLRIVFVRSAAEHEKLKPALTPGNVPKTMAAPVVAILGYDLEFWRNIPKLFPHRPEAANMFRDNAELAKTHAFRNGTLQAAYFMIAARAVGLDCGPMSGFDNAKVDEAFFAGTTVRSNFLCNLGYGDESKVMRKLPRLKFEDACKVV